MKENCNINGWCYTCNDYIHDLLLLKINNFFIQQQFIVLLFVYQVMMVNMLSQYSHECVNLKCILVVWSVAYT